MIITPAISQEKIAAGPAMAEALKAPKSQPEPMMEPIAANSSPMGPTSRFSPVPVFADLDSSTFVTDAPPDGGAAAGGKVLSTPAGSSRKRA